jgi:acyl-[acyl-carrier-protein]-phospholipid O-acyltransferase/long-chain-fatty-acid--[acyl-carrier-protein] ligase
MVPDYFIRLVLWCLTHTVYRIRIVGRPNIPARGPALLVCNHVSMIDGALVGASLQRFVRFIVYAPHFRLPILQWLMTRLHAIPIMPGNRRDVVAALERARAELAAGHVVCIFAEGAVSRTGNLLPFKRGFERILEGLDVPVIPVYLDRVWGSIFSFKRGRFFWKLPERLPYPVTVAFGQPIPHVAGEGVTAARARQAILELGAVAMQHRREPGDQLHTAFIASARRQWRRLAMADSTGQSLTYGRALTGAVLLARAIRARTPDQPMVGVLLPASVGGALANIATLLAGRIPVNLNFTAGPEAIDGAIEQCGIRTVLTSKRFLSKIAMPELPGMVFLEDLRSEFGTLDKLIALLRARLVPARRLARGKTRARTSDARPSDAIATVIFSSGSTGVPKGVVISHSNILSNVDSLAQIFPMRRGDCFIGVLPLFHSSA